jgi:hypothetical protein
MRIGICVSICVFVAMFASQRTIAAELTGAELLEACLSAPQSVTRERCESYIAGVFDGIDTFLTSLRLLHPGSDAYPSLYCVPPSTTNKDLVDATVEYLTKHPSTRHFGASSEILLAVEQAYPCGGSK